MVAFLFFAVIVGLIVYNVSKSTTSSRGMFAGSGDDDSWPPAPKSPETVNPPSDGPNQS